MVSEERLTTLRDDALSVCDMVEGLRSFSDLNAIGDGIVRHAYMDVRFTEFVVSCGRRQITHRLPRMFWLTPVHYIWALERLYLQSCNSWIECPTAEESRFIALANGVEEPRYETVDHYLNVEAVAEGRWTSKVKTAHEVVASLWQHVRRMDKYLSPDPPHGKRSGELLKRFASETTKDVAHWDPQVDTAKLKEAVLNESVRSIHAASGAALQPSTPVKFSNFWIGSEKSKKSIDSPPQEIGTGNSGDSAKDRFLGLIVNERHGVLIQRDGYRPTVRLDSGSAEMHTFLVAWSSKEIGATQEQWNNGYPGERRPELMRNVKSRLNEKLSVLDVQLAPRVPPKLISEK